MNFYNKHILPKYLNWMMQKKDFEIFRKDVTLNMSGLGIEIGFGSGLNLIFYKDVIKLYALDLSEELYTIAKDNLAKVSFPVEHIHASAEHIPLPDNFLDFAVSTWSLCSISNPELALKEIFRVLKPNGKFSFIEHGKSPKPFIFKIQNLLTPISKQIAGGCHMNRDIERLILENGFEIEQISKHSTKSKPLGFTYKGVAVAKK